MKNAQGEIRKLKKEIEKGEFGGLIIDRAKSQQEIDTQIDRLADGFRTKESSDGIHELGRDGSHNSGGLGAIQPEGEYLDHHPIPQVVGELRRRKRNDTKEKKRKSKICGS